MFLFAQFLLLLDRPALIPGGLYLLIEVAHGVRHSWMFEAHVLGHRPLGAVRLFAVRDRADVLPFDFAGTPPHPLLLLVLGGVLVVLDLVDEMT
jgi:hypothetical protein